MAEVLQVELSGVLSQIDGVHILERTTQETRMWHVRRSENIFVEYNLQVVGIIILASEKQYTVSIQNFSIKCLNGDNCF